MAGEMFMSSGDGQYDAVVVLSFGGPEGPDEVMPFLQNVTRGRNVPDDRLREVARNYELFGGISPINGHNRRLVAALAALLQGEGPRLPVYFGNRNWHPFLADTLRQMAEDGIKHAVAFATSAYSSYSACRQYLEDIARARAAVGDGAPRIDKLRPFWNHPGFILPMAELVDAALAQLPDERRAAARLVCSAHSLPLAMARSCDYELQLRDAGDLVVRHLARPRPWDLAFQSRSGPPGQPWLEPDILDHLEILAGRGVRDVVNLPIGFTCDHMEVVFDLDTQARQRAAELGIGFVRVPTVGVHPRYVAMIRELILERSQPGAVPQALGELGPRRYPCAADCCPSGR